MAGNLDPLVFFISTFNTSSSSDDIFFFIYLTTISFSDVFVDKTHVAPRLNFVNVPGLNKLLRSEVFISEDRQLRAAHLILDYEPLSRVFQDIGQAIRAGNPRLARIDVLVPRFLARRDLPPVELPLRHAPREVAAPREETASSRLSLEAEIDQFRLEEEGEVPDRLVELLDFEIESDKFSAARSSRLVVVRVDTSSEEEEGIDLNPRRSLKSLVAGRNKGSSSKEVPESQIRANLPPSLPPSITTVGLLLCPDLKKNRKVQDVEEGAVIPPKGAKQPKNAKDKRTSSIDNKEDIGGVEVRRGPRIWALRIELEGALIPGDATMWES